MPDATADALASIDAKLSAILALLVDRHLRDTDVAKPRPRSIDRMLTDVGLTGVEISRLLGKTPQAVSQALAKDGKPPKAGGTAKRTVRKAASAPADADESTAPAPGDDSAATAGSAHGQV